MKQFLKMLKKQVREEANKNGVNLTTNDEVKSSSYKVAVTFGFTRKGDTYKGIAFVVDRNMFEETLASCKTKLADDPMILKEALVKVIELGKNNELSEDATRTIILNYLCCFSKTSEISKKLEDQSLGFLIDMETAPLGRIEFWGGPMKDFAKIVAEFIKEQKPV